MVEISTRHKGKRRALLPFGLYLVPETKSTTAFTAWNGMGGQSHRDRPC